MLEWYNEMIGPVKVDKFKHVKSDVNTSYDYEAVRQTIANSSDVPTTTVQQQRESRFASTKSSNTKSINPPPRKQSY